MLLVLLGYKERENIVRRCRKAIFKAYHYRRHQLSCSFIDWDIIAWFLTKSLPVRLLWPQQKAQGICSSKSPLEPCSTPTWKLEDFSMHGCNFNNLVLLWSKWSRQTSGKKKNRPISDVNSLLGQCNSEVFPPPKPPPPCRVFLLWRKPKHSSSCLNWKSQKVLQRGGNGAYGWCTSPHTFLQTAISHAQFLLVWQLFRVI